MFTGIVEELGRVIAPGPRLEVASRTVAGDSAPGASVAVNGVCLTVVERRAGPAHDLTLLAFDLSEETLSRSAIGRLRAGDAVNLERPVTLLGRLGGHLVQGHVDGVGTIAEVRDAGSARVVAVELPAGLERYVVEKGSIALDGVSLTVTEVRGRKAAVALIPHTLAVTTFGRAAPGDPVNVEVDLLAKYAERLLGRGAAAEPARTTTSEARGEVEEA